MHQEAVFQALLSAAPNLHRKAFLLDSMKASSTCQRCGATFTPARKNQRFCARSCQKNAARGDRSLEKMKIDGSRRARADRLISEYLGLPQSLRLAWLKKHLDRARSGDRLTADVLTFPRAFRTDQASVFADPRAHGARVALPHLAEWFCRRALGCHVGEWVSGKALEPETGEIAISIRK